MGERKVILVTGGAGSMGRGLVRTLSQAGHRVRAFDLPFADFSSLEGLERLEVIRGDITGAREVREAVRDVDAVVHLAAILPPASEEDRERTIRVNVGGTRNLFEAITQEAPGAHLILSSSVAVYGDTTTGSPPIKVTHPRQALDFYAESKIGAEEIVLVSSLPYTILRISGVAVPAFLAPPEVWPFMREQRMEFVARDDVVRALAASVETPGARGRIFNIAGGESWRMLGHQYVERFNQVLGLPPEEGRYLLKPGWFDWYDTSEGQAILDYQKTSFPRFLELLRQAIEKALGI